MPLLGWALAKVFPKCNLCHDINKLLMEASNGISGTLLQTKERSFGSNLEKIM
jgi:hypothetical protein